MDRVTLATRHLTVSADVPDAMANLVRNARARAGGRPAEVRRQVGRFVFVDPTPTISLEPRDPALAVAVLRTGPEGDARHSGTPTAGTLQERIDSIAWYHTIDLPGGIRTPGAFDHHELVPHYGLPDSLAGQRVLDVNTFDGFWAFEFERRGAEVVANDIPRYSSIDFPPQARAILDAENLDAEVGAGFKIAHEALGSKVEYRQSNVYDLNPETYGTFDLVHVGDLLLHLENPIRALRAIRSVTHGRAMIVDCFDPSLGENDTARYLGGWHNVVWNLPSLKTLAQMIADAGFSKIECKQVFYYGGVNETADLWRATLIATV